MTLSNFTPLSATPQGGLISGITTDPVRTVIHAVPKKETHHVQIRCNNTHTRKNIRVVGDFKGGANDQINVIDVLVPNRETPTLLLDQILNGPCTIEMSAIENSADVRISGFVEVIRRG